MAGFDSYRCCFFPFTKRFQTTDTFAIETNYVAVASKAANGR